MFEFSPIPWEMIQFDEFIFVQMGWLSHLARYPDTSWSEVYGSIRCPISPCFMQSRCCMKLTIFSEGETGFVPGREKGPTKQTIVQS